MYPVILTPFGFSLHFYPYGIEGDNKSFFEHSMQANHFEPTKSSKSDFGHFWPFFGAPGPKFGTPLAQTHSQLCQNINQDVL